VERLFVRILNSTLLVCAVISLLVVLGALVFLGLAVNRAVFAQTESTHIAVPYQPANVISGQGGANPGAATPDPNAELLKAARASCDATNALGEFISNKQLSLSNADKCPQTESSGAQSAFGDRAENYLTERAAYIRALLADPQARAMFNIPAGGDVAAMTQKYVDDLDTNFAERFHNLAAADDARKAREIGAAIDARTAALGLGAIAGAAFFAFLVIAFLIVAVRLEKHLGHIAEKA